ncbi:MAG: rod shape-determining protein RodA [Phoenicibacter congonensis]|uniref:Rod shape-determining protein RodA n=1 Tax=Phoenicibacter congonensis TaxID=1944646 RepID=A0AA43RII9_9ACTN|nr:rod shape-determining protein RodA [Phoenicibacter congonensis]
MAEIPTLHNVGGFGSVNSGRKPKSHMSPRGGLPGGGHSFNKPAWMGGFNVPFMIVLTIIVLFGLIVCHSAVSENEQYSFSRQLVGLAIGLVCFAVVYFYDYKVFERLTIPLLVITVIMILSPHLPVIGVEAMGARSWVKLGMQFQPGEFAKVTVILFAASLLAKYEGKLDDFKEYCKVCGLLAIPFVCILTQPDLGTGLVYLVISAVVVIMGGAKARYVLATVALIVVAFLALLAVDELLKTTSSDGTVEYKLLKNYQRSRLFVFLNQGDADSSSDSYNLNQAMIAIGSGGLFGKGLGGATQSTLGFLPEAPTDFIFCVLSEELGFVGALSLLVLYGFLLFFTIKIGHDSGDLFGMLICLGVSAMWFFQILENIGMCIGVMPITGIPLPFVSYGSSFMIVNFTCSGLVANVWRKSLAVGGSSMSKGVKYAKTI